MHDKIVITAWTLICVALFSPLYAGDNSNLNKIQKILERSNRYNLSNHTSDFVKTDFEVLKTPQSETEDVIKFLSKLPEHDRKYLIFFTTYNIKKENRDNEILVLSFIIHSLMGIDQNGENLGTYNPIGYRAKDNKFIDVRRVPDSTTLWWINIQDYNWSKESWEKISKLNSYFFEPCVSHETNGALRLLAGNVLFRADWFIANATQTTAQIDLDINFNIYTELLYSLNKIPKNVEELDKVWGFDEKKAKQLGNESGVLVTKSQIVSRHNRQLFRYRTDFGYRYRTYDVKNQSGKRDYLSSLFLNSKIGAPPDVGTFDAGEIFFSNSVGMQVYALNDGNNNLVFDGATVVVRHLRDVLNDTRVRVSSSCLDCHAGGPLTSENTLVEFIEAQAKLKVYDKHDALRIKRNLLSRRFEDSISEDQLLFERSLKRINGLDGQTNGKYYLNSIVNYYKPIDLDTAAFECGVTVEELVNKVKSYKHGFGARTKLLVATGEPIPRDIWENIPRNGIPGAFQETMIILNGVTKLVDETTVEEVVENVTKEVVTYVPAQLKPETKKEIIPQTNQTSYTKIYISNTAQLLQRGWEVIDNISQGQILHKTSESVYNNTIWYFVATQSGKVGYVKASNVRESQIPTSQFNQMFIDSKTNHKK